MKYHYQYVSKNAVRIELLPEDQQEKQLIEGLSATTIESPALKQVFQNALENYRSGARLSRTNFMAFPKVALCTFAQDQIELSGY